MSNIVIIGSGLAGYTLAREIRKIDKNTPLQIFTMDDGHFYSKPMLSNAIVKNKTVQTLVTTPVQDMETQLNADILTNTIVKKIAIDNHIVLTDNKKINYSKLIFAVGASQISPKLEGNGANEVITINNLQDYARFQRSLESVKHVAIIGPGLIGCEFANDIIESGRQVTVIGPGKTPLDRLLPHQAGKALQDKLAQLGVLWRLGVTAHTVSKDGSKFRLTLSDDSFVEVDMVISAVGLIPNTRLADTAGLKTNRGIVVNRFLQSSDQDVYALGDCAEIDGLVLPFVLPIMHSARALAKTVTNTPTEVSFPAMPVVVKTPAHAVIVSPPAINAEGDWNVTVEEGGVRALFQNSEQKLLGFVLTGSTVVDKQKLTKELPSVLE